MVTFRVLHHMTLVRGNGMPGLAFNLRDQELNRGPRLSDQLEGRRVGNVLQRPAVDGHDAVAPLEPIRALDVHFSGLEVHDVDPARGAGELEP